MPKSSKGPPLLPKQKPQRTPVPRVYQRLTIHAKKTANTRSLFYTTYAFDFFSSREDAFLELPVCSCHVTHRDVATHTEE